MIVLFTDFGIGSPYQAQLQAALHMAGWREPAVDLHADLACYDVQSAAYLLAAYLPMFPPGTVFVCVVDPGVGNPRRRPVVVECQERLFVGPDNGLFNILPARFEAAQAWEIRWRPEHMSVTFHGRDLFAPIAARIKQGNHDGLESLQAWPNTPAREADLWEVIYIDHYGNLFSGLRADQFSTNSVLACNNHVLRHARTYSEVPRGAAFWYKNSIGLVEFAVNQGSAAERLQARIGDVLTLRV